MGISNELISQLVKVTGEATKRAKTETTTYGTIVVQDGSRYVRLDGSDLLTPISTTADAIDGERVTVMIKNHTAVVTGNLKSPAARVADVEGISEISTLTAEGLKKFDEEVKVKLKKNDEDHLKYNKLVPEYGTSGIWSYKVLPEGEIELWGAYSVRDLECEFDFNGWYRTDTITPEAFPFEIHDINLVASYESDGHGGMLWATTATTATNPPSYYLIQPTNDTIVSGKISFRAIGRLTV